MLGLRPDHLAVAALGLAGSPRREAVVPLGLLPQVRRPVHPTVATMNGRVTFHVPGRPVPQGSTKAMLVKRKSDGKVRPVVMNTAGNPPLAEWRMKVTSRAVQACIEAATEW